MIEAFGVKNLRCLTDTGLVPIKPITLLVGRNSSGKSTFLRALPLLRQSVENPRRSPILWSHRTFVDFGSLEISVNERNKRDGVTISFQARMNDPELTAFVGEPLCELSMTLASAEDGVYLRAYDLDLEGRRVQITFGPDGGATSLTIDGRDMLPAEGLCLAGAATLIPSIDAKGQSRLAYLPFIGQAPPFPGGVGALAGPLKAELRTRYPRLSKDEYLGVAATAPVGTLESMAAWMRDALTRSGAEPLELDSTSEDFRRLCDLVLLARLPQILSAFDWAASKLAFGVRYLGPQRSVGERQ